MAVDVALDELDPALRPLVRLTDAPFVEGAVMAAVAAAGGAGIDAVAAAAESAASTPKHARS
jgi:PTS hybrid protein